MELRMTRDLAKRLTGLARPRWSNTLTALAWIGIACAFVIPIPGQDARADDTDDTNVIYLPTYPTDPDTFDGEDWAGQCSLVPNPADPDTLSLDLCTDGISTDNTDVVPLDSLVSFQTPDDAMKPFLCPNYGVVSFSNSSTATYSPELSEALVAMYRPAYKYAVAFDLVKANEADPPSWASIWWYVDIM
jgi:hypothetical protein